MSVDISFHAMYIATYSSTYMEVCETSENLESGGIYHDRDKQPLITVKRIKFLQPAELAAEGNLNELTKAIDLSQIDHKYEFGFTLLHYAAKDNRLEVIEYLVSSGCDINAVDDDKNKLLFTNLQCLVMQKLLSCWLVKEQMLIRLTTMATLHFM